MSEKIDKPTEGTNSGCKRKCQLHSCCRLLRTTATETETETDRVTDPAPTGEAVERYLSHTDAWEICACGRGDRSFATRAINISHGLGARTSPW